MQLEPDTLVKKVGETIKGISESLYPHMDITEEGNKIRIYLDVPGFEKDNINITAMKYGIKVTGKREKKLEGQVIYEERVTKFSKYIRIMREFDSDSIEAKLENGVLKIILTLKNVKTVKID